MHSGRSLLSPQNESIKPIPSSLLHSTSHLPSADPLIFLNILLSLEPLLSLPSPSCPSPSIALSFLSFFLLPTRSSSLTVIGPDIRTPPLISGSVPSSPGTTYFLSSAHARSAARYASSSARARLYCGGGACCAEDLRRGRGCAGVAMLLPFVVVVVRGEMSSYNGGGASVVAAMTYAGYVKIAQEGCVRFVGF
ncbi:hypothetical protein NA57DRAFT_53778 [Rhizodiscina lignyota]|uniref:Uncharacterized protein n=1 Tax=Rhizodiscina lignyota TaxID=1504668 RepID=A0A9P4M8N3_9PEZI|nr:hypothetical protein NA57DRAFT_53778 [Rhizodiscina lignyota]